MKIKLLAPLTLSALLASSVSQADTLYDFSYTGFDDSGIISGSFYGSASGNLITGLSQIQASVNGVALVTDASGYLYGASYDFSNTYNFLPGNAIVSFDGKQNNFIFQDVSFSSSLTSANFIQSITDPAWTAGAFVFGFSANGSSSENTGLNALGYDASQWSVTAVTASTPVTTASSVPLPTTTWLFLTGLLGFLGMKRKSAIQDSQY